LNSQDGHLKDLHHFSYSTSNYDHLYKCQGVTAVLFILLSKSFNLLLHKFLHIAQDLLDSWLHEKKRDDFNLEVQFKDEKWAQRSKPLEHVTRNSVTEDYYDDPLDTSDPLLHVRSRDWTTLNSSHTSQSPNLMGKLFSVDLPCYSSSFKNRCYSMKKCYL